MTSKGSAKKQTKKHKKKKNLKKILKSFVEHPIHTIGEEVHDFLHPEVVEDIKEHVEDKPKKEEKPKENPRKDEMQGDDSSEDLAAEYEIPMDYAYEQEKESADYVLKEVKKKVGAYPLRTDEDVYEPGEGLDGDYENFEMKRLEKLGILPGGIMKYLNPVRKKMMEIFSLGRYKNKKD